MLLPYVLERLPRINQLQLQVLIPDGQDCTEPMAYATAEHLFIVITLSVEDTKCSLRVPLPIAIDSSRLSLVPSSRDFLQIRAPVLADVPRPYLEVHAERVAENVEALFCKFCGEQVTTRFLKTLSLPSKHWQDVADLWTCEVETFQQFARSELRGQRGKCLVGSTYVLLNKLDLAESAVIDDSSVVSEGDKDWQSVACGRCYAPIGFRETVSATPQSEHDISFRLSRHLISSCVDARSAANVYRNDTLETLFAHELIASIHQHMIYRFVLQTPMRRDVVHLHVTNWEASVQSNAPLGEAPGTVNEQLLPALHLSYVDFTSNDADSDTEPPLRWSADKVERLTYRSEECVAIVSCLRNSTAALPASRRTFDGMTLGFLRLSISA
eukprot:TRINITY_DN10183_c0_g1_i1.p1 TRINITY_DN10183_c0_g1~~TRINITY_DN10183_c0_g1_i1.p1  ORF type:complete len:384 (-),score=50.56 TRINITY_DN10183_c0_g1_i1:172-1323(-)